MDNLTIFKEIAATLSKLPSRQEFLDATEAALELVAKSELKLTAKVDTKLTQTDTEIRKAQNAVEDARTALEQIVKETRDANETTLSGLRKRAVESIDALFTKLRLSEKFDAMMGEMVDDHRQKIGELENKILAVPTVEEILAQMPETEQEMGEDIVEKINALSTDDDEYKIDASHIKNLPKSEQKTFPATAAFWNLQDVDVAGIAAGQSIQWDGVRWIAYTPAGSGGTPVWGEDLTSQGVGTSYTLAHTPLSGTLRLFRGGAYQQAGAGKDYTLSGTTITLSVTTQAGEVLLADYSY